MSVVDHSIPSWDNNDTQFEDGREIPSYFFDNDFNVDGHTLSNDRLSHENELAEYFLQHKTDKIIKVADKLNFDVDISENPLFPSIMMETMEDFRNILRDAVTKAVVLISYDRDDLLNIKINDKRLRNKIKINIIMTPNVRLAELTASDFEGEIVTFEARLSIWMKKLTITLSAEYICPMCEDIITRPYKAKMIEKCDEDGSKYEFHKPKKSEDIRRVTFKEVTDDFSDGKTPATISADIYGKTVWETELNDKVIVTGVFRSVQLTKENGKLSQEFMPTIQVIGLQNMKTKIELPDMELMKKFKDLEDEGKLVEAVIDGFAYNIYKKRMEKKSVICSLIGSQWIGEIGNGNPPMIHILFVGDPDTYKSTIMKYIINVYDNCVLADATTVSNAGIKAIAIKMDNGRFAITAGLLPTYNRGVLYLDEFGDLKSDIYADLKAPMIDGRVTKNVGGENFDGAAETGVLGSMNPIDDMWSTDKTMYENLSKLGRALITRFDIIFLFSIDFNNLYDDEIQAHMDKCDLEGKPDGYLTDHEIKLFLNYAKSIPVEITKDAFARNSEFFAEIKKKSKDKKSVETRTKNAIMKFAVALAKWHMSTKVTAMHVDEALELYGASMKTLNMDFENGEFVNEASLKETTDGRRTAIIEAYEKIKDPDGYAFKTDVVDKALDRGCFKSRGEADALVERMRMQSEVSEKNKMIKITPLK